MEFTRIALGLVGILSTVWGLNIVFNRSFYTWWRDTFWNEPNDGHLSRDSLIYNRYIEAGCDIGLGIWLIYLMLFLR
jgi:multisubunit Na+/H+ antiporter MnhB subunit